MARDGQERGGRTLARGAGRAYADALGDVDMTFRRTRQRAAVVEILRSAPDYQRSWWGRWSVGTGVALMLVLAMALARRQGIVFTEAATAERGVAVATDTEAPSTKATLMEATSTEATSTEPNAAGAEVEDETVQNSNANVWVQAPSDVPQTLALGPSASGVLAPNGAARSRVTPPLGAEVWLERGHVQLDIEPGTGGRWVVHAGPFRVDVVGTVFSVNWDGTVGILVVEVARGEVRVSGGELAAGGVAVTGGQRADVTEDGREVHVRPSAQIDKTGEQVRGEKARIRKARRARTSKHGGATKTDATKSVRTSSPAAPDWRGLFERGQYPQAYDAATLAGIDRLLKAADAQTLHELADVARLRRDLGLAERTLKTIRSRFPGSREAARAAFELGRIAADKRKNPVAARRWFEIYLEERPGGTWARDARGRVLRSLAHESTPMAREAAAAYLRHHPDGPDADTARRVLEP